VTTPSESGARARTRRAILDAAFDVFAKRPTATLSDVADAAQVGRSTLHRYFPDRAALIDALVRDGVSATEQAFNDAALDQGSPIEALRRLVPALFDIAPRMNFLFAEADAAKWKEVESEFEKIHWPVGMLIHRGRKAGVFDRSLSDDWIVRVLWYLMSAGAEAVAEGAMVKHEAISSISQILENGVRQVGHNDESGVE
jgi:AcrR family transcriptional regulator